MLNLPRQDSQNNFLLFLQEELNDYELKERRRIKNEDSLYGMRDFMLLKTSDLRELILILRLETKSFIMFEERLLSI